jgi:hypothetical protein
LDALGLKNALRAIGRGHRQIEAIFVLGSRERETRSQVTTRNSKRSFSELPISAKYIHAAGLCAVALAITLLMTPAALHRIAFRGEDVLSHRVLAGGRRCVPSGARDFLGRLRRVL